MAATMKRPVISQVKYWRIQLARRLISGRVDPIRRRPLVSGNQALFGRWDPQETAAEKVVLVCNLVGPLDRPAAVRQAGSKGEHHVVACHR